MLEQPDELEGLDQLGVGPAAFEVLGPVELRIRGGVEGEVVGEQRLDQAPVAGLEGTVDVAGDPEAIDGSSLDGGLRSREPSKQGLSVEHSGRRRR